MARMGMDADLVEQSGRQLKSQASELGSLVTQLDRLVNGLPSVWDGPDSQRFVHQWWPEHRKTLTAAQQQIDGLGQSALNNASEQRQVSSVGGAAAALAGGAAGAGGAAAATKANGSGQAVGANGRNAAAVDKFVDRWGNEKIDYDGKYGEQCFDVFRQYNHDVTGAPGNTALTSIKASAIYTDFDHNGLSPYYERIAASDGSPQPGDVIVYRSNDPSGNGHVAVVTEVGANGDYKVIEQNYNPAHGPTDPAAVRPHNLNEKGTGVTVLGYLRPKDAKV